MGNGRILVNLLMIASDYDKKQKTQERSVLCKFCADECRPTAYHKVDKLAGRFLPEGRHYPYEKFTFKELEKCEKSSTEYKIKLTQMSKLCGELFTDENAEQLTQTLLEIVRSDNCIDKILYGGEYVAKDKFYGNSAHPKQICLEAFLLGLIHHTHTAYEERSSAEYRLSELDTKRTIRTVRYENENSLNLDLPLKLEESLQRNSRFRSFPELPKEIYNVELRCGNDHITSLPELENILLSGSAGVGKTTILLNEICKNRSAERVFFYMPLSRYRCEIHENFSAERCGILLNILLEFHYQNEYRSYESCAACEGEETLLRQLLELENILKTRSPVGIPKYVLMLDGMNEMSSEMQGKLMDELQHLCSGWKNVQFVISGQNSINSPVFRDFKKIELCGISDSELKKVLSELHDHEAIFNDPKLMELLKNPLFLKLYLDGYDKKSINTRGELLDSYVMNWEPVQASFSEPDGIDHLLRLAVRYAFPFAAKLMINRRCFELDRADLADALDRAIDVFLKSEQVFYNYIAPKNLSRAAIIRCREEHDILEIILRRCCFMSASETDPQKIHFVHKYYRDYFAARCIINLLEATVRSFPHAYDEKKAFFGANDLGSVWFRDEEIYRLIGEITGDYKNAEDSEFPWTRNILDELLELCREFFAFRTTENVIRTMSLARNGIISDVDFSGTALPMEIPADVRFRDCDFSDCHVFFLEVCENFEEMKNSMPAEQFDHFKDCDFSGAKFVFSEAYREILIELGAEF